MIPLVLVVGSDPERVAGLQCAGKAHGLKLHAVPDLALLRPLLTQWRFDVVLCDAEGCATAELDAAVRWLRREQRAPIVVLAGALHDERAELAALEAGATELVARDASPRIVAIKLQRLVDLASGSAADTPRSVSVGELQLDPLRAEAVFRNRVLKLTRGEFELLHLLATRSDRFVHRDTIVRSVGRAAAESRRSADMHVCRIRRKLREVGATTLEVETVYGRGYALRVRSEEELDRDGDPDAAPPALGSELAPCDSQA